MVARSCSLLQEFDPLGFMKLICVFLHEYTTLHHGFQRMTCFPTKCFVLGGESISWFRVLLSRFRVRVDQLVAFLSADLGKIHRCNRKQWETLNCVSNYANLSVICNILNCSVTLFLRSVWCAENAHSKMSFALFSQPDLIIKWNKSFCFRKDENKMQFVSYAGHRFASWTEH